MTQTFLDTPNIIKDIIRRKISTVSVDVVEDLHTGSQKAPIINIKGGDPEIEHLGRALDQHITPITVACWHRTDSEADDLRKEVVNIFTTDANYINPVDKDSNSYGINHISIEDYDSDDVRALRGNRYARTLILNALWFLDY